MEYEQINFERRGQVQWLYLNRPLAMNSMTSQMMIEMLDALAIARSDAAVRVLVLGARGKAFCTGTDLKAIPDPSAPPTGRPTFLDYSQQVFAELRDFPKPVVAALNGVTCAGGLEMALNADIVFAAQSARIGDAHSNFALLPGAGNSVRLPRLLGPLRAKYLMFTGDLLPASEVLALGLVNRVVDDGQLEGEVQKLAERLAAKSPLALRRMKELVRDGLDQPMEVALRHEYAVMRDHVRSHDVAEGLKAFAERRTPDFKGY